MSRIAVLGGTFDPVHWGHLAAAEQARDSLEAAEAWLVPAGQPPLRPPAAAPALHRLALARAAVSGRPRLRVLDLEVQRPGPSYTVDTLDQLVRENPQDEIWLVVGADAASTITRWHRAAALLARGRFAVVSRAGAAGIGEAELTAWGFRAGGSRAIAIDSPPIDASDIRRRVAAGETIAGLVPDPVARLIAELGLYGLR